MRRLPAATALALAAALVAQPLAAAEHDKQDDPQALAREGIEQLMRALGAFIEAIPMYEMPELNERGDIIIRRKNPPKDAPDEPGEKRPAPERPEMDQTKI